MKEINNTLNMRKQIIDHLNHIQRTTDEYTKLKSCLILESGDIGKIDSWFEGVIMSLYYKPNRKFLVLCGPQAIGKTEFFRRLLPQRDWYSDTRAPYQTCPDLYEHLIVDMSDFAISSLKQAVSTDGFRIKRKGVNVKIETDKRLASICYTTNKPMHPLFERRRAIVLHLKDIDRPLYNSIDKHALWIEIYNKFVLKKAFHGK